MKETISYYYNLKIDELEEKNGKYYFQINGQNYFFVYFSRNENELNDLLSVCEYMITKGYMPHTILLNINGSYFTEVDKYKYVLFMSSNVYEKYDIFDLVKFSNTFKLNSKNSLLYRNNWSNLWSQKVDYFEYQIRQLALDKEIIKKSFSYYIGLAENAILYVNIINKKFPSKLGKLVLSHRRIFYPNYKINFLNPLSFVFDLEVRDAAEYFKSMFFNVSEDEVVEDLKYYLKISYLSPYELNMFMARLLYPSYYFDLYEDIMNLNKNEDELLKIIKKNASFEKFLKKVYLEISKYTKLEEISWLIN